MHDQFIITLKMGPEMAKTTYNCCINLSLSGDVVTGIRKITFPFVFLVLVALALAAMIGISLSNYTNQARLALSFRYPLDYGEGPLLDQTLRMAGGENIYHNNFAVPPY